MRLSAAAFATSLPFSVLPVKQMTSNFDAGSALDTSTPPWMTLMHLLSRYLSTSTYMACALHGPSSEGLTMAQFPVAMALANGFKQTK